MIYLDTSVIMAAISREPMSGPVRRWMAGQAPQEMCVSDWVSTELSSALAIKMRRGEFTQAQQAGLLSQWRELREASLRTVAVPVRSFAVAADFIDQPGSTLRAGDGLHLAIASLRGYRLATLDIRLTEAATRTGVPVETIV